MKCLNINKLHLFQSDIVLEQLALQKRAPPGSAEDPNIPLYLSVIILLVGLTIVFANLTEKKTSLILKCVGPCLVMLGLTAALLRILFSYAPAGCRGMGCRWGKEEKNEASQGVANHEIVLSNDELGETDMARTSDNLRGRQSKIWTSYQPEENNTSAGRDSFLNSTELENVQIRKGRERRRDKKEEIVLDVSNIS